MGWMSDEHACYGHELWLAEQWENEHTEGVAGDDCDDDCEDDFGYDEEEW